MACCPGQRNTPSDNKMNVRPPTDRGTPTQTELGAFQERLRTLKTSMLATTSSGATLDQLLAAVETMQLGVTITDESGVILYANPAQARMLNHETPDALVGKDVSVLCLPGYRDRMTPGRLLEMKSWGRESVNVRRDGSLVPVRLLSDVVRGPDGEPVGVITTCEDLTEIKQAETERNLVFPAGPSALTDRPPTARVSTDAGATDTEAPFRPENLPGRASLRWWSPVSVGKLCPHCGKRTLRARTTGPTRLIRMFLPLHSSTRECDHCGWRGLALHRR